MIKPTDFIFITLGVVLSCYALANKDILVGIYGLLSWGLAFYFDNNYCSLNDIHGVD